MRLGIFKDIIHLVLVIVLEKHQNFIIVFINFIQNMESCRDFLLVFAIF